MLKFKAEESDEILKLTIDQLENSNVSNEEIVEALNILQLPYEDPLDFPISKLDCLIDDRKKIKEALLESQQVFQNCVLFLHQKVINAEIIQNPLKPKMKLTICNYLQDNDIARALFFIYSVFQQYEDSHEAITEDLINDSFIIAFNTSGLPCYWSLLLLSQISSINFDLVESNNYVRKIGCLYKSYTDEKSKKYALNALSFYMSIPVDQNRKSKIINDIILDLNTPLPTSESILRLISNYIESDQGDIEFIARRGIIPTCISLLRVNNLSLTRQTAYTIVLLLSKVPDEYLMDETTITRLVEKVNDLILSNNADIAVVGINVACELLNLNQDIINNFEIQGIVQNTCERITECEFKVAEPAFKLINMFIDRCNPNFISIIIHHESFLVCFELLTQVNVDYAKEFVSSTLFIFKKDKSWLDIDLDHILENLCDFIDEQDEPDDNSLLLKSMIEKTLDGEN